MGKTIIARTIATLSITLFTVAITFVAQPLLMAICTVALIALIFRESNPARASPYWHSHAHRRDLAHQRSQSYLDQFRNRGQLGTTVRALTSACAHARGIIRRSFRRRTPASKVVPYHARDRPASGNPPA